MPSGLRLFTTTFSNFCPSSVITDCKLSAKRTFVKNLAVLPSATKLSISIIFVPLTPSTARCILDPTVGAVLNVIVLAL